MFLSLRQNFGNASIVFPLTAITGVIFHANVWETLYAATLFYIVAIILLMLDDMFTVEVPNTGALMTEAELDEMDITVSNKNMIVRITNITRTITK